MWLRSSTSIGSSSTRASRTARSTIPRRAPRACTPSLVRALPRTSTEPDRGAPGIRQPARALSRPARGSVVAPPAPASRVAAWRYGRRRRARSSRASRERASHHPARVDPVRGRRVCGGVDVGFHRDGHLSRRVGDRGEDRLTADNGVVPGDLRGGGQHVLELLTVHPRTSATILRRSASESSPASGELWRRSAASAVFALISCAISATGRCSSASQRSAHAGWMRPRSRQVCSSSRARATIDSSSCAAIAR